MILLSTAMSFTLSLIKRIVTSDINADDQFCPGLIGRHQYIRAQARAH